MNLLVLDTSTSLATVAIAREEIVVAESTFLCDRTLSSRLVPEIGRLLQVAGLAMEDLDLLAGAVGPGSFTGVRAGLATLQGLALAISRPCASFSSLALLAMNFPLNLLPVCSMLDARKKEVYTALFDVSDATPHPLIAECVTAPEQFLEQLKDRNETVIFTGDGALAYGGLIRERLGERGVIAPSTHCHGRAGNAVLLAMGACRIPPEQLLPVYLRASEAEYAKLDRQKKLRSSPPSTI